MQQEHLSGGHTSFKLVMNQLQDLQPQQQVQQCSASAASAAGNAASSDLRGFASPMKCRRLWDLMPGDKAAPIHAAGGHHDQAGAASTRAADGHHEQGSAAAPIHAAGGHHEQGSAADQYHEHAGAAGTRQQAPAGIMSKHSLGCIGSVAECSDETLGAAEADMDADDTLSTLMALGQEEAPADTLTMLQGVEQRLKDARENQRALEERLQAPAAPAASPEPTSMGGAPAASPEPTSICGAPAASPGHGSMAKELGQAITASLQQSRRYRSPRRNGNPLDFGFARVDKPRIPAHDPFLPKEELGFRNPQRPAYKRPLTDQAVAHKRPLTDQVRPQTQWIDVKTPKGIEWKPSSVSMPITLVLRPALP